MMATFVWGPGCGAGFSGRSTVRISHLRPLTDFVRGTAERSELNLLWLRGRATGAEIVSPSSIVALHSHEFELMMKFLIATLWEGGYPHEILCYMFSAHIEQSGPIAADGVTHRRTTWPPRLIAERLSNIPLSQACGLLEKEYIAVSSIPEEYLQPCFLKLHFEMKRRVLDLVKPSDQTARLRWSSVLNHLVGATTLENYYNARPEENISDWSYKVLKRVRRFLLEGNWLERPLEELCLDVKSRWIGGVERDLQVAD